jgi:ATP-dependent DNA helicase RecG
MIRGRDGPTGFASVDRPERWPRLRGGARPERLEAGLGSLPGVGPKIAARLRRLGLGSVRDLLEHRPRDYQRAVGESRIVDLFGEQEAVIVGEVRNISLRRTRRRLTVLKATVADESGSIPAVWFNQDWLAEKLVPGTRVRLRGQLRRNEFAVRSYDLNGAASTADLAPIYPAGEEITPPRMRALVTAALAFARDYLDSLPASLKARETLPTRADALVALHRPRTVEEAETGRQRLAFEELLLLQLGLARRTRERERETAPALGEPGDLITRYLEALPFRLTEHQEHAIEDIDRDLARELPMQRLLQGDVGSGKTVVALYALLRAVEDGYQGALMAPTETLAEQHFLTVEELCRELGVGVGLLTSSVGKRARDAAAGASILVGTHALIQEGVELDRLAVAVVDEQHRFGVEQRAALTRGSSSRQRRAKPAQGPAPQAEPAAEGRSPHVLHMTATPIPRTLALTVYGDLAVSEIAKPPASRKPVVTSWIEERRASEAYRRLTRLLREGRQAYVVCPLIEESETSRARAAEQEAERLRRAELKGFRVGCLHGKLKPADRRELMARFKARELDVLVATTVIEVGVDVANATVMIVQEADRFGLAQLHQLRGRVGRGAEQSYCLLVSRPKEELTEAAVRRLEALVETTDGFDLAEVDLELRGEGQLLGTRQSGLSDLRFTKLRADRALLERARETAQELLDHEGPIDDELARLFPADGVAA